MLVGVLVGTKNPSQLLASKPGSPDPVIVGILGATGEGLLLETPIAVNLPAWINGSTVVKPISITWTLPDKRSLTAGAAPL